MKRLVATYSPDNAYMKRILETLKQNAITARKSLHETEERLMRPAWENFQKEKAQLKQAWIDADKPIWDELRAMYSEQLTALGYKDEDHYMEFDSELGLFLIIDRPKAQEKNAEGENGKA